MYEASRSADHRIVKEAEKGLVTAELCRQHGISKQTLCRWKAEYGGLEGSDAKNLKALEDESRKLDNRDLEDVLLKNW